ncbi:MAG: hypothetical protein EPN88_17810 [Bacteroidetes bacterium]|nr:MAG: hypothetical protein EPN88_17810 [Bacteroidota bacterium]
MKKIYVLLITVFLVSAGSVFQLVNAQVKTKAEIEQDQKILKSIDEQKKALADQKKALEDANQALKDQQAVMGDSVFNISVEGRSSGKRRDAFKYFNQRGNMAFAFDEPFDFSPGVEGYFGHGMGGDNERTSWDFSKSVKENTFSKNYSFDVEKTVNTVVMSVMGDCKAGEIRIKIIMPNGKNYSDILIDEFGNLNWRKSFTISEKENQDKAGEWKFQINSTKATGFFKISLQTY